MSINYTQHKE